MRVVIRLETPDGDVPELNVPVEMMVTKKALEGGIETILAAPKPPKARRVLGVIGDDGDPVIEIVDADRVPRFTARYVHAYLNPGSK